MSDRQTLSRDVVSEQITSYIIDPDTGQELETKYKDPTDDELAELHELEEAAEDGDVEAGEELEKLVINDFHLNDEFTASNTGNALKQAIFIGFMRAIGDNESIQEAEEFFDQMESQQGNQ